MGNFKHTKGPWSVNHSSAVEGKTLIFEEETGNRIATIRSNKSPYVSKVEESVANAHLISAAPELLASLEEVLNQVAILYIDMHDAPLCIRQGYSAIAKARGEM